jgi:hypothetical protein
MWGLICEPRPSTNRPADKRVQVVRRDCDAHRVAREGDRDRCCRARCARFAPPRRRRRATGRSASPTHAPAVVARVLGRAGGGRGPLHGRPVPAGIDLHRRALITLARLPKLPDGERSRERGPTGSARASAAGGAAALACRGWSLRLPVRRAGRRERRGLGRRPGLACRRRGRPDRRAGRAPTARAGCSPAPR